MKDKNKISVLFTLGSKVVSVNQLYKAKVVVGAHGRPVAQIYRSAESKKMEQEIQDQLRAVKFTPEQLKMLQDSRGFDINLQFIFRTGFTHRDVSNACKAVEDVWTRFVHNELGITRYDDSLHVRVILSKCSLKESKHEYILLEVTPNNMDTRYDLTPKPRYLWFYNTVIKPEIKPIPKRKKKGVNYIEEATNEDMADCFVYIFPADYNFQPETILNLTRSIDRVSFSGSGFIYLGFLGSDSDWLTCNYRPVLSKLAEEVVALGDHGRTGFIKDAQEIEGWWI